MNRTTKDKRKYKFIPPSGWVCESIPLKKLPLQPLLRVLDSNTLPHTLQTDPSFELRSVAVVLRRMSKSSFPKELSLSSSLTLCNSSSFSVVLADWFPWLESWPLSQSFELSLHPVLTLVWVLEPGIVGGDDDGNDDEIPWLLLQWQQSALWRWGLASEDS